VRGEFRLQRRWRQQAQAVGWRGQSEVLDIWIAGSAI
jgi:hypothetical protein